MEPVVVVDVVVVVVIIHCVRFLSRRRLFKRL